MIITTTTTTSTTTPTTPACVPTAPALDLTLVAGEGVCGTIRDASGLPITGIPCGALVLGAAPLAMPPGATSRFGLFCTGSTCSLGPDPVATGCTDCTDTGCGFGVPLPATTGALSFCLVSRFAAAPGGILDLDTGAITDLAVPLSAAIYVTGNAAQPCPRCSGAGTPSSPGIGVCGSGAHAGRPCTSTNPGGLTRDCLPDDNLLLGSIPLPLSPVTTGLVTRAAADGNFCLGQPGAGCFGWPACRSFDLRGVPAGPLADGQSSPVTLVGAFCQPPTGTPIVDVASGLPSPGAVTVMGTLTPWLAPGP